MVRYSYFPPPYIWSNKGDNVGPWSPDNEDWFTNRVKLYKEGNATLRTVDEWAQKVKGFKETRQMMSMLEEVSRDFIAL